MQVQEPVRGTTEKRTVRWLFEELDTLRKTIIARAGRLTRPQGKLTLTLNANPTVKNLLLRFLQPDFMKRWGYVGPPVEHMAG